MQNSEVMAGTTSNVTSANSESAKSPQLPASVTEAWFLYSIPAASTSPLLALQNLTHVYASIPSPGLYMLRS